MKKKLQSFKIKEKEKANMFESTWCIMVEQEPGEYKPCHAALKLELEHPVTNIDEIDYVLGMCHNLITQVIRLEDSDV
jgi:hypothetical protein